MSRYNDLVDNVATLMKYWYKNEVSGYYNVCDEAAKRVDNVD